MQGAATYLGGNARGFILFVNVITNKPPYYNPCILLLSYIVSYAYDSNTGNTAFTFQMILGCQAAATALVRYDIGKVFSTFR